MKKDTVEPQMPLESEVPTAVVFDSPTSGTVALAQDEPVANKDLIDWKSFHVSRHRHMPQGLLAWLVLVPALIFIILFMVYPIINTFIISLFEQFRWVDGAGSFSLANVIRAFQIGPELIDVDGISHFYEVPLLNFQNYIDVLSNASFLKSLGNTAELVVITVPLTVLIGLVIAISLNSIKAVRGFFQTIFFLPYVTNTIALGMVFQVMFDSGASGLVNTFLNLFGVDPIKWLDVDLGGTRFTAGVVIVVYTVWNGLAFKILILMGGLATIDRQYYDAARIDGSKGLTIVRRITLPLLSPQLFYIIVTSFIGAFKTFTGVRAVFDGHGGNNYFFGGNTGEEWMPIGGWIYKEMKVTHSLNPGQAAAGSVILLAIILVITGVQFLVSKTTVHY
jgi:multiple sugar transport system permease protein